MMHMSFEPSSHAENPSEFEASPSAPHPEEAISATPNTAAAKPSAGKVWLFVLLRLLFFLVPLGVLWFLTGEPWFSAIAAALIGFALSLLLLQRQRDPLLQIVYQRTTGQAPPVERGDDELYEDEVVDTLLESPDESGDETTR